MEITIYEATTTTTATIIVDAVTGTLRPKTHEDGRVLGVGYGPGDTVEQERQRAARAAAVEAATEAAIEAERAVPACWRWLDHNGHDVFPL